MFRCINCIFWVAGIWSACRDAIFCIKLLKIISISLLTQENQFDLLLKIISHHADLAILYIAQKCFPIVIRNVPVEIIEHIPIPTPSISCIKYKRKYRCLSTKNSKSTSSLCGRDTFIGIIMSRITVLHSKNTNTNKPIKIKTKKKEVNRN
jgi:hypothetical protein